jgi:hypothetical protein
MSVARAEQEARLRDAMAAVHILWHFDPRLRPSTGYPDTGTRAVPDRYHMAVALTVRTDELMEQALDALVEAEGVSRQEVIRRSVLDRYERTVHVRRVAESTSQLMTRWGDVLDRLGHS